MGEMGNIFQNKKFLIPGDARINDKCPTLINSRHDYSCPHPKQNPTKKENNIVLLSFLVGLPGFELL